MGGDEMKFVQEAFESNYIAPLGPQVDAFEKAFCEYTGFKYCIALTSGTAAMHLALRYLLRRSWVMGDGLWGKGKAEEQREKNKRSEVGDRRSESSTQLTDHCSQFTASQRPLVLASTLTFIGSVTPATFEGCDITFIDCDRDTWNMDPDLLAAELERCDERGRFPVAVIPTDLYGQCCDLARIVEICDRYDVPVICDSAEAMGARYRARSEKGTGTREQERPKSSPQLPITHHPSLITSAWRHAGYGAKAGVFSFNGNKIITTSGGGMLASDDEELIEKARFWSQQAREPFPYYEHTEIGYNYRMSNIVAAIGLGQLQVLDDRVRRKREIFEYYREALGDLPGIEFMPEADYNRCTRWLTVLVIDPEKFGADREDVRLALEAENIEARPVWKPMHMQPVFCENNKQNTGKSEIRNPKSETIPNDSNTKIQNRKKIESNSQLTPASHPSPITHHPSPAVSIIGGKVSEELFEKGLCLPSGTAMSEEDLGRVVKVIKTVSPPEADLRQ